MLLIDDRDGSRELAGHPALSSIPHRLTRLRSGDISFIGHGPKDLPVVRVGIELKHIGEAVGAMDSGRLQATQIPHMMEDYDEIWLLVYGRIDERDGVLWHTDRSNTKWLKVAGGKRKVTASYPLAVLMTATRLGCHYHLAEDLDSAAWWVAAVCYNWWSRPYRTHSSFRKFDETVSMRSRRVNWMQDIIIDSRPGLRELAAGMCQWPCMGWERCLAAAEHFGSLRAAVGAGVDEWRKVKGIGPVVAQAVVDYLGREV